MSEEESNGMNDALAAPLEATHLRGNLYAVRPVGQLGTVGWYPCAWTVQYIRAQSARHAVAVAAPVYTRLGESEREGNDA